MVEDFRRKKRPPFDAFPSVSTAIKLMSEKNNCLRLPKQGDPSDELNLRINRSLEFIRSAKPAVVEYLRKNKKDVDWLSLALENLQGIEVLFEKYPSLIKQLEEEFDNRGFHNSWLDFARGLTRDNANRLPWIWAQMQKKEKGFATRQDAGDSIYKKLFGEIGDQDGKTFCILLALSEGFSLERAFQQYQTWWDRTPNDHDFVISFHKRGDRFKRWQFITQKYDLLVPYLENPSFEDADFLERLELLPPGKQEVFLKLDFNALVPAGREAAPVIVFLADFAENNLLDIANADDLKIFKEYIVDFGLYKSAALFGQYRVLKREARLLEPAHGLGIRAKSKETKESLLNKLRNKLRELRDDVILKPDFDTQKYSPENPLVEDSIKFYTDFEDSAFRRSLRVKDIVNQFESDRKNGLIAPLNGAYKPAKISLERLASGVEKEISNEALQSYLKYYFDLDQAQGSELLVKMRNFLEDEINDVQYIRQHAFNVPERTRRLSEKLPSDEKLDQFRHEFRKHFSADGNVLPTLIKFEIENDLGDNGLTTFWIRRLVFAHAIGLDYGSIKESAEELKEDPDLSDLEKMIEIIANNIKEHALGTLNLSKEEKEHVAGLFNVGAMKRGLNELKNIGAGKFSDLLCFPTRGLLAEFSGYSADACWTNKQNIMRDDPDMAAVFFISSPDNAAARRLAGACLLKEATVNGETAMVIRGINPKQNLITQFTSVSFWNGFLDYAEGICRARGIKKILLPLHNQNALSNRPSLQEYFEAFYADAPRVTLDQRFDFNGYDATEACVVVRTLSY